MKNGVKGIFLNKATLKYEVRLNRRSVTYTIGRFPTYEEAITARTDFLNKYNDSPPEEYVQQYSKQWWEMKAKEQREKFRELSK